MSASLEDFWSAPKMTALEVACITEPGLHRVDDNLYLQIAAGRTPRRSWIHRYQLRGRPRASGLGSFKYVTLAQARARRNSERRLIGDGIDPVDARKRGHP
jgi:Arm DNA-binding domain